MESGEESCTDRLVQWFADGIITEKQQTLTLSLCHALTERQIAFELEEPCHCAQCGQDDRLFIVVIRHRLMLQVDERDVWVTEIVKANVDVNVTVYDGWNVGAIMQSVETVLPSLFTSSSSSRHVSKKT